MLIGQKRKKTHISVYRVAAQLKINTNKMKILFLGGGRGSFLASLN